MDAKPFKVNAVALKVNKLLAQVPTTTERKERFNLRRESRREIPRNSHKIPERMAGATGFEPATYGFGDHCSTS